MESTCPKNLRAELKDYLDMASEKPIRIQRRAGSSYILMNEEKYLELQNELISLQRRLLGMSEIVDGKVKKYIGQTKSRLKRFKSK